MAIAVSIEKVKSNLKFFCTGISNSEEKLRVSAAAFHYKTESWLPLFSSTVDEVLA